MTVSTTIRKAGPFTGNGVTTVFPFVFRMFSTADLVVVQAVAGVESTLLLGVDYAAILNADQDANPGGQITMTVAPAVGRTLVITSNVPATQLTLITNAGGFFPKVFNAVFDKAVILIQQLAERVGRAITVPITSGVTSLSLPVVASAVLRWNSTATAIDAITLPDLSLSLALPDQVGHANHALFSTGVAPLWRAPLISDVTGLLGTINYLSASIGQNNLKIAGLAQRTADLEARAAFALNAAVIF